jgi:magnesium-transporting ATPase (P-type)
VVDESMLTGDPRQHTKGAGEAVFAGSFCIGGHGAYEAQKLGDERLIVSLTGDFEAIEEELTPLERTMRHLLRFLLVVVAVLSLLLLADYFDLLLPIVHVDAFASAASVIFGLAPSSLFLMILVNYAMGTAELARIGALVHRTRSVESLAQATVICFAREGILTGVGVEVEPLGLPRTSDGADRPRLAESRIRQILGDYAHSTSAEGAMVQAMLAAFPGDRRHVREEAPFLSLYGWSAVAFDDSDLRGVYVVGNPDVLDAYLAGDDAEPVEAQAIESQPVAWRERLDGLWRSFTRSANASPAVEPKGGQDSDAPGPDPLKRMMDRVNLVLRRQEGKPPDDGEAVQQVEETVYLLAYYPGSVPLHTAGGRPHLPQGLIPICRLRYVEQVRREAVETVQAFSEKGVGFKVFSADEPERIATILKQAGLGGGDGTPLRTTSGSTLAMLDRDQLARAAIENTIFGQVTPKQAGQMVEALREQGEVVAVVGDGVSDLAAMQQAHLSITRQSSSPAALSVADIVLLEDSHKALLGALDKGQRIANGLLDILKLYLNQISYLVLLILAIWGMGMGFPYQSKQGSLITVVSVLLPSLGLSLWAPAGVLPRSRLGWLLARFVAPAAVTMSAAAVVVYRIFLTRTGDVAYAQLAITYTLVISGLVLVVLLRPPVRGPTLVGGGGNERSGDWRPAALVLVLLVLVLVAAWIPLAEQLFGLTRLQQPVDYAIVGLAVLAWAFAASFLWRVRPLERLGKLIRR